jgi:hypothetical protein
LQKAHHTLESKKPIKCLSYNWLIQT